MAKTIHRKETWLPSNTQAISTMSPVETNITGGTSELCTAIVHKYISAYGVSRFDSSVGRGDFATEIGTGKVIKGVISVVLDVTRQC